MKRMVPQMGEKIVLIGKDGRCTCSCGDPCPLGRVGSMYRCTKQELETAGVKTEMEPVSKEKKEDS